MNRIGILAVAAAAALAGCARPPHGADGANGASGSSGATGAPGGYQAQVARGKHLVTTMGCNDCHTPWKMGPSGPVQDVDRLLSGHPADLAAGPPPAPQGAWNVAATATFTGWSGPWGVTYSSNLTPDEATGLGSWTEDVFLQTIRNGKHMGTGRPLLPPMPVPALQALSDDDLKAMYAYLRTIPAIANRVPDAAPAAPPQHAAN